MFDWLRRKKKRDLNKPSSTPPGAMWLMTIKDVAWDKNNLEFATLKEVDGFFVLRKDIKALYESMGYLDQEMFEEMGIPELGVPDFERKYGVEEDE